MNPLLPILAGVLLATGLWCLLRRSPFRIVVGLGLLGNGANLAVFLSGGAVAGRPPMVPEGATAPAAPYADPLPQALVLTAIVIGFGLTAYALALLWRAHAATGRADLAALNETDALPPPPPAPAKEARP